MIALPMALQEVMFKEQMKMPQITIYIPSGTELSFTVSLEPKKVVIFVGFSFAGIDVTGSSIPPYDFTTGKGLTWSAIYRQHPALHKLNIRDHETGTFYLTEDYLNKQIQYGPRICTKEMEITLKNTLDNDVYFSQTAFAYELWLEDFLKALGYTKEQIDKVLEMI